MSEFTPNGGKVRMTKTQVKKYLKDMEEKRTKAKLEIEKAHLNGELNNDIDLEELDKKIEDLF